MLAQKPATNKVSRLVSVIIKALKGEEMDYTQGNLRKAVILLAIPMTLEMVMESIFALVDTYFVGHLPNASQALQIVGLTESVITIIYSIAMGMSMAATAMVARRIGEKDNEGATKTAAQILLLASSITILLSALGMIYAKDILLAMGASEANATAGKQFVQIMMGSGIIIMLLFLINGIFRGAGNAAMAMKSLMLANICNIILCPILINGLGPIPALGLNGAAWATTIGRGIGVCYQLYHMFGGKHNIRITSHHWKIHLPIMRSLVKLSAPATLQFIIASCSWLVLARLVATTSTAGQVMIEHGGEMISTDAGSAGYQTALRLMMFFILPAWGLSNAAATLVGQNLGAKQIDRAQQSVMITMKYNVIFMAIVTVLFFVGGNWYVSLFTEDAGVRAYATEAVHIVSVGYVFYGIGMVLLNSFNGAGDTWTPTIVNFFGFWIFQIPFAYFMAVTMKLGPTGVFIAIPVAETLITIASFILFRRGKWKTVKV